MATSLLKSFIEAVTPAAGQAAKKANGPQGHKTDRRAQPHAIPSVLEADPSSKSALETQSVNVS